MRILWSENWTFEVVRLFVLHGWNNGGAHSGLWLLYILPTTRWRCFRQSWCFESLPGTIREKHRIFERPRFSIPAKRGFLNAVQTILAWHWQAVGTVLPNRLNGGQVSLFMTPLWRRWLIHPCSRLTLSTASHTASRVSLKGRCGRCLTSPAACLWGTWNCAWLIHQHQASV